MILASPCNNKVTNSNMLTIKLKSVLKTNPKIRITIFIKAAPNIGAPPIRIINLLLIGTDHFSDETADIATSPTTPNVTFPISSIN